MSPSGRVRARLPAKERWAVAAESVPRPGADSTVTDAPMPLDEAEPVQIRSLHPMAAGASPGPAHTKTKGPAMCLEDNVAGKPKHAASCFLVLEMQNGVS